MNSTRLGLVAGVLLSVGSAVEAQPEKLPEGASARLGSINFRPGYYLNTVACSPDGKVVATSGPGKVALWDAGSGRLLREWSHYTADRLAFTSDGKGLLACGYGDTRRYDVSSEKEFRLIPQGQGPQRARRFDATPDQRRLVLADPSEKRVYLWDLETGQELRHWDVPRQILSVAISQDGRRVAATGYDPKAVGCDMFWLWDATTGKVVHHRDGLQPRWYTLLFAPDGKTLLVSTLAGDFLLLDGASGQELRRFADRLPGYCSRLAVSSDGKVLATAGGEVITVWDVASGKIRHHLRGHNCAVTGLAFGPAGKQLFSVGNTDCTIRCWDVATGKEVEFGGSSQTIIERLRFRPDGKELVVEHADAALRSWNLTTLQENVDRRIRPQLGQITEFGWARAGPRLFWASDRIHLGDGLTGKEVKHFGAELSHGASRVARAIFLNESQRVLGVDDGGGIHVWDAESGKKVKSLQGLLKVRTRHGYVPLYNFALTVAPEGRSVLVGEAKGAAVLIDLETEKTLWSRNLEGWKDEVNFAAFSPDGRWVLVLSHHSGRALLEVVTGRPLWQAKARPNEVDDRAAFSPDGWTIATSAPRIGWASPVQVWEARTGLLRLQLQGHRGAVMDVAFSPDGKLLASGGADTTVLLWDMTGANKYAALKGKLTEAELTNLWDDLGSQDGERAFQAVLSLATSGQAPAFLQKRLRPVTAQYVKRLVEQLADDQPEARLEAQRELADLGKAATTALAEALENKALPPEAARSAKRLWDESTQDRSPAPAMRQLRQLRAIEALERDGGVDARALLRAFATGLRDAELTQEATAALRRLEQRLSPGAKDANRR